MTKKRYKAGGAFLFVCLTGMLFFAAVPASVSATSHCNQTVSPGDDIQTAINNAGPGETVCVEAGTYNQDVVVNESITLEADGDVILDGTGLETGILVTSSNATVDGFALDEYNTEGLTIESADSVSVSNTSVNGTANGIVVNSTTSTTIMNSTVTNSSKGVVVHTEGTTSDVVLEEVGVSENDGPGLELVVRNGGTISGFRVNESLFQQNRDGVAFNLSDGSLTDVEIRRTLISNNTNGLNVTTHGGTTYDNVSITENLINDSDTGVYVDPAGDISRDAGFELTRNLIQNNSKGVDNRNGSAVFDARLNYWGDSDGPSSSGPLSDPASTVVADGSGDSVSEGSTSGESNVRFAPAIGGKSTCDGSGNRVGDELVDRVPNGTVEIEIQNETISGPKTDFVGLCVWDRAAFPLRAGTDTAANSVRLPDISVRESGVDLSINRQNLAVYNTSESIPFTFQKTDGTANIDMFANEDAQLVVGRITGNGSSNISLDVNTTSENVTFGNDNLDVVQVTDTQLNNTGELPNAVDFTPQQNGTYVAILVSQQTGDGFQSQNGNLTFDLNENDQTIIGVEGVAVQTTASSATPQNATVSAGDSVTFDVDANLGQSSDVNHTVLLYDESTFVNSVVTVTDYNTTFDNFTSASGNATVEVTPPNSPAETATIDAPKFLFQSGTVNGTYNGDPFESNTSFLAGEFTIVNDVTAINATSSTTTAGDQTTLTLQTESNWNLGDYRYVHVAVSENGEFSTTDGIVGVGAASFTVTGSSLSTTEITEGNSVDVTATVENTGTVTDTFTANMTVNGSVVDQKSVTVAAGDTSTVTFTRTFNNPDDYAIGVSGTSAGTLTVTESTTGGGVGGGFIPPEPTEKTVPGQLAPNDTNQVDFDVPDSASDLNLTLEVPETNESRAVGTRFTTIDVVSRASSGYRVTVDTNRTVPASAQPLGAEASPILYANISYTTDPASFRRSTFNFQVNNDRLAGGDPSNVALYRYNETTGEWKQFETEVRNVGAEAVSFRASTDGFSVYAIAQEEPDMQVTEASLSESQIQAGDAVDIEAIVENQGDGNGTETIELTADGESAATQDVTLSSGESTTVTFTESFDEAGSYEIAVGGVYAGTLEVTESDTGTGTATETPAPGDSGRNPLIYVAFILLLILAGAGFYLYQREQA